VHTKESDGTETHMWEIYGQIIGEKRLSWGCTKFETHSLRYTVQIMAGNKLSLGCMKFVILMVMKMSVFVFQVVMPCGHVSTFQCCGRTYYILLHYFNPEDGDSISSWNVSTYTSIQCYNSEDYTDKFWCKSLFSSVPPGKCVDDIIMKWSVTMYLHHKQKHFK
jgi:hypothetical protein